MEYISKEKVLDIFAKHYPYVGIKEGSALYYVKEDIKKAEPADVVTLDQLKKAWAIATADVVEVVRCKDCVYFTSGANECESWEYCHWFGREIDGNEFCSYGDRKERR